MIRYCSGKSRCLKNILTCILLYFLHIRSGLYFWSYNLAVKMVVSYNIKYNNHECLGISVLPFSQDKGKIVWSKMMIDTRQSRYYCNLEKNPPIKSSNSGQCKPMHLGPWKEITIFFMKLSCIEPSSLLLLSSS